MASSAAGEVELEVDVSTEDDRSKLYIPIRDTEEVVEVELANLPEDPNEIIDVLKPEFAPLDLWLKFAVEYFKRGKVKQFKAMLMEASGPEAKQAYGDRFKNDRVAILNTLGAYYTLLAQKQTNPVHRDRAFGLAAEKLGNAMSIDSQSSNTWVGKGMLLLAKNDIENASYQFGIALESQPDNVLALLGRACTLYLTKHYQEALNCYKKVLNVNPAAPAAVRLGFGLCYFKLKLNQAARESFLRVLEMEPDNANALVGLAVLELNEAATRFQESERKAARDKTVSNSMVGLSELEGVRHAAPSQAEQDGQKHLHTSMLYLESAYKANPRHGLVLTHLADHFFYLGDYDKARVLAQRAKECTRSQLILSDAEFQLARIAHVQEDYEAAHRGYHIAITKDTNHMLALLGFAQTSIHKGKFNEAADALEKIAKKYPDDYQTLRLMGAVYAKINPQKAREVLKRATKLYPYEFDLWLQLAQVNERSHMQESYTAYTQAIGILSGKAVIPVELWNNLGVVALKLGKLKEAQTALVKGLSTAGLSSNDVSSLTANAELHMQSVGASPDNAGGDLNMDSDSEDEADKDGKDMDTAASPAAAVNGEKEAQQRERREKRAAQRAKALQAESSIGMGATIPPHAVTSLFNLALVHQKQGDTATAVAIYRALVRQHPTYIAAYLKLGNLELDAGNMGAAREWYKRALEADKSSLEAHSLMAALYYSVRDYSNAGKWYKRLLKAAAKQSHGKEDAEDSYARLGMANLLIDNRKLRQSGGARHAARDYRSILEKQPANVFAANGLGVALAEQGQLKEAGEVFAQVKEAVGAAGDVIDFGVNLAHTLVAYGQFENAIKLYTQASQRSSNPDTRLLLYLARAHYLKGDFLAAKGVLLRALHVDPCDQVLWYNMALSQEEYGIFVLQKPRSERTFKEVTQAVRELRLAAVTFSRLAAELGSSKGSRSSDATPAAPDTAAPAANGTMDVDAEVPPPAAPAAAPSKSSSTGSLSDTPCTQYASLTGLSSALLGTWKSRAEHAHGSSPETPPNAAKADAHAKFCQASVNAADPHLEHARQQEAFNLKVREESQRTREMVEAMEREEQEALARQEREEREKANLLAMENKRRLEQLQAQWQEERAERQRRLEEEKAEKADEDMPLDKADEEDDWRKSKADEEEEVEAAPTTVEDDDALAIEEAKALFGEESEAGGADGDKGARKKRRSAAGAGGDDDEGGKKKKKKKEKKKGSKDGGDDKSSPAPPASSSVAPAAAADDAAPAAAPKERKRRLMRAGGDDVESEETQAPPVEEAAGTVAAPSDDGGGAADSEAPPPLEEDEEQTTSKSKRRKGVIESDDEGDGTTAPPATSDDAAATQTEADATQTAEDTPAESAAAAQD